LSYAAAGVDIGAYERVLERVKPLIAATQGKEVAAGVGPFAGLYALPGGGHLAASADGVGTKIKVAIATGNHRVIGADIVNHCVNDIATAGARPLFFLDYFATGKLEPDVFALLIEGMTSACGEAGCALLGGETAEMPGVYALGDYDLAGFIVGLVEAGSHREPIKVGDVLVGLPSTGLHTNGYSERCARGRADGPAYFLSERPCAHPLEGCRTHHRWRHPRQLTAVPARGNRRAPGPFGVEGPADLRPHP